MVAGQWDFTCPACSAVAAETYTGLLLGYETDLPIAHRQTAFSFKLNVRHRCVAFQLSALANIVERLSRMQAQARRWF